MSLKAKLDRLEKKAAALPRWNCPNCQAWDGAELVAIAMGEPVPTCPRCGRNPPEVIVEVVVERDDDGRLVCADTGELIQ